MDVAEIIKHPSEHRHICVSVPACPLHYQLKLFKNKNTSARLANYDTIQFSLGFFFLFLLFILLHVIFNSALASHVEANSKLVIAGYTQVNSLIRTMCS